MKGGSPVFSGALLLRLLRVSGAALVSCFGGGSFREDGFEEHIFSLVLL